MAWEFKREESKGFDTKIPEGKHRIRLKSAEKNVSKSGNDMLTLQFEVSGYKGLLFHYITFMADRPEITNRMLTQFYDAFKDIPEGDTNLASWIGKVGACVVKHEDYNGNMQARLHYFIPAEKQADLPAWVEPEGGSNAVMGGSMDGFVNVPQNINDEVPF